MFTLHYILHFISFLSCLSYNSFLPHIISSSLFIFLNLNLPPMSLMIRHILSYHVTLCNFTSHPRIIISPLLNNSILITSQRRGLNATGKATKQQMDLGGAKEVLANRVRNQSLWKTRKSLKIRLAYGLLVFTDHDLRTLQYVSCLVLDVYRGISAVL